MNDSPDSMSAVWASYRETVLVFDTTPEVMIDLRVPVSSVERNALGKLGLGEPFGVLTSFNPGGRNLEAAENERRFVQLAAELRREQVDFAVVDGCSPDRLHRERSAAVKTDRDTALEIASRWDQLAIFWWDRSSFWVYGTAITAEPMKLPAPARR